MMKVYNKSTLLTEKAKQVKCPRCSGFGRNSGDEENCFICNGYGYAWISQTGWTRAFYARQENSQLY